MWATALKEDSTLLMPATLAKLAQEEAASVSQLCSLLLMQHAHYLDPDTAAAVSRLMLAVLLHHAAYVRRAGMKAVAECLAEKPHLAGTYPILETHTRISVCRYSLSDCAGVSVGRA